MEGPAAEVRTDPRIRRPISAATSSRRRREAWTRHGWPSTSAAPSPTSPSSWDGKRISAKVLTTPRAPEEGVLTGIDALLQRAGSGGGRHRAWSSTARRSPPTPSSSARARRTALVATEGFRDSIEMAFEHRFEQYDIFMDKPLPLVPRELRFGVPERLDGRGNVLLPLDEAAVRALAPTLKARGIEAVAIGFMHAYLDGTHERRTRDILAGLLPGVVDHAVERGLARDPRVRALLDRRRQRLRAAGDGPLPRPARRRRCRRGGFACPLFLMTSGGGLTTLETARRFPDPPGRVRARPAAPSWRRASRGSAGSTRCCPSTWAARRPRSA